LDSPGIDALAALPAQHAVEAGAPELWGTMLRSFGMLLVVLGILLLVLWLLRRYSLHQGSGAKQEVIRMVASLYVGPKERIALVDVLGEKILIGITPQQISYLARIEDEKDICGSREADASGGFFKTLLRRKLRTASESTDKKGDNR
jgi:flagellar protein FliO/FliZ